MDLLGWIFIIGMVCLLFTTQKKKNNRKRYNRPTPRVWAEPRRKHEPTVDSRSSTQTFPQQPKQVQEAPQTNRKIAADGFRYDPEGDWPFERRKLITATESILFERLRQALPDHYIFTQVQLSQLVSIRKGHSFKTWFSRISQMSVDFVVADEYLNTIAAVELDDKSHYTDEERHKADAKKDKVLTAAGIRVIRWRCEIMPSVEQIALAFPECKRVVSKPEAVTIPPAPIKEAVTIMETGTDRIEPVMPSIVAEQRL